MGEEIQSSQSLYWAQRNNVLDPSVVYVKGDEEGSDVVSISEKRRKRH